MKRTILTAVAVVVLAAWAIQGQEFEHGGGWIPCEAMYGKLCRIVDGNKIEVKDVEHRWASDLADCKFTASDTFRCTNVGNGASFSYVNYDCVTPKTEPPCALTDEERARGLACFVVSVATTCKLAVLDWCLSHGDTRVLKEEPK